MSSSSDDNESEVHAHLMDYFKTNAGKAVLAEAVILYFASSPGQALIKATVNEALSPPGSSKAQTPAAKLKASLLKTPPSSATKKRKPDDNSIPSVVQEPQEFLDSDAEDDDDDDLEEDSKLHPVLKQYQRWNFVDEVKSPDKNTRKKWPVEKLDTLRGSDHAANILTTQDHLRSVIMKWVNEVRVLERIIVVFVLIV